MDKVRNVNLDVGFRIRRLREEFGLSQGELAERVGVSFQQVQKYETGKNKVSLNRLYQIAEVFNTDASSFLKSIEDQDQGKSKKTRSAQSSLPVLDDDERRMLKLFRRLKNVKFRRVILLQLRGFCDMESNKE